MAYGILGASPSLIAQQQRIASLPADPKEKVLAGYITNLAQQNKVGTPEYYMAAGEFADRQRARKQKAANQEQPPSIAQQINQQALQLAENQGIAKLPVGGIGEIGNYAGAGGGIVAFDDGGEVQRYQNKGFVNSYSRYTGMADPRSNLFQYTPEEEEEQRRIKAMSIPEQMRYLAEKYGVNRSLQEIVSGQPVSKVPTATPAQVAEMTPVKQGTQADIRKADIAAGGINSPSMPATTPPYVPKAMQEQPSVPVAPAAPSIEAILAKLGGGKEGIAGLTTKQSVADIRDAMKEAGYDPEFFKKQIQDIESKKVETKSDKQDAMNMRLIEAGLGILGGESPYAFVNIGKGASPALKGLQEDLKDIAKLNRDYDKAIRDLQTAEQGGNRDIALKAVERKDRIAEKIEDRKFDMAKTIYSGEVQKQIAGMPGATERLIARMEDPKFANLAQQYFKFQNVGSGTRVTDAILQDYAKNPWKLEALKDSDPNMYNYIKSQLSTLAVPSAVTAPIGKVRE